jgi:predicted nucleotidyltransferase
MNLDRLGVSQLELAEFCRRNHVRKLAIFGSALTERFKDSSDIDILVEFEPDFRVGYLRMAAIERELSSLFGGRRIDLRTAPELSRHFRDEVLKTASVQYAAQ